MKIIMLISVICLNWNACTNDSPQIAALQAGGTAGGRCEGCEAIYLSPIPFAQLNWEDTLPDFNEPGPRLVISGVVYKKDGTPAKDVVIYIYHTNQEGVYLNRHQEKGWAGRHGYIRGWVKSDEAGRYRFYTLRPAPYPGGTALAHIHPILKEPGVNEYWIDEFVFADDPALTPAALKHQQERGGSGVLRPVEKNGILYATRDVYLGKNIPGYPQ
ncbi:MAG TPA: hypothetical protein VFZ78_00930 [Flavisolibacter sp.]